MNLSRFSSTSLPVLLLLILALISPSPSANKKTNQTCRTRGIRVPHQSSLFRLDFPNDENVEAICDGTITVDNNGDICIAGRVSYAQIGAAVGKPIRAPAMDSVSITGHLTAGTGNVVLGSESRYLYDFVKNYTCGVGGMTYPANDGQMTNRLMAARCGLITNVCLDATFAQDESFYHISHDLFVPPQKAIEEKYTKANVIHVSGAAIITEYHVPSDKPTALGTLTQSLVSFVTTLTPGFILNYFPLFGATGILRYFVWGSVSTVKAPQPIVAPDFIIENIQLDTAWTTLMLAMRDGLFTEDLVPPYFNVLVKKLSVNAASNGCWKEETAAIDFYAPDFYGAKLDVWMNDVVLPALTAHGHLTLHMGKRLAPASAIVQEAFDTYKNKCNVDLDIDPMPCYHPACTRSSNGQLATNFVYPPDIFQPINNNK
jgi:hypothetical protein